MAVPKLILSYELLDDPGQEYEVEVRSLHEARQEVYYNSHMILWACLSDENGDILADTNQLI